MLSYYLLLQAAAAGLATGQSREYQTFIAAGTPYGSVNPRTGNATDLERFAEANQNPNVTRSFDFTPFYQNGVFNTGQNSPDTENVWTLRVNVTDFPVSNARPAYPGEQPDFVDPHLTNTVFELDWHEDESFRSALNRSTAPACVAITTASFLPNVTNLFTEDNDSGDCAPVLGEECTNAILASGGSGLDTCSFDTWEDLPECASTIGASRSYAEYGLSRISFDLNSNSSARNVSYEDAGYGAIANGTDGQYGFLSVSTDAYSAANTTLYDEAATRLHVMVLSVSPVGGQFGLWSQKALCVRADPKELEVENSGDVNDDDSESGSDSDGSGDGNFGSTLIPGAGTKGATLALAGLWLAMVARL